MTKFDDPVVEELCQHIETKYKYKEDKKSSFNRYLCTKCNFVHSKFYKDTTTCKKCGSKFSLISIKVKI